LLFWPRPLPSRRDVVVLAEHAHAARLRSLLARLLDKRHCGSDHQLVESVVQHACAMEIDTVVAGLDEPVPVHRRQLDDLAVRRNFVRLDSPALLSGEVLQTAACGIEGVVDGDTGVAVHALDLRLLVVRLVFLVFHTAVQRRLVTHDNRRTTRNGHLDADVKVPPVVAMAMRDLDEDAAPHDARVELFQPFHALSNV